MNLSFVKWNPVGQWNICQELSLRSVWSFLSHTPIRIIWLPTSQTLPSNCCHLGPVQAPLPGASNMSPRHLWRWALAPRHPGCLKEHLIKHQIKSTTGQKTPQKKRRNFPPLFELGQGQGGGERGWGVVPCIFILPWACQIMSPALGSVAVVGSSWATLGKTLGSSKVSFQICKIRIIVSISLDLTILEIIHVKRLSQHWTPYKAQYYQVLTINNVI